MRLKNKKTGEIREFNEIFLTKIVKETNTATSEYIERSYPTIAELNADWEDYTPAEPLIKDEKIRKAVRAWAEACGAKQIKYSIALNQYYDADMGTGFSIKFLIKPVEVYLEEGKIYTLAELCGGEEE